MVAVVVIVVWGGVGVKKRKEERVSGGKFEREKDHEVAKGANYLFLV